jgi:hypothetical protein
LISAETGQNLDNLAALLRQLSVMASSMKAPGSRGIWKAKAALHFQMESNMRAALYATLSLAMG